MVGVNSEVHSQCCYDSILKHTFVVLLEEQILSFFNQLGSGQLVQHLRYRDISISSSETAESDLLVVMAGTTMVGHWMPKSSQSAGCKLFWSRISRFG